MRTFTRIARALLVATLLAVPTAVFAAGPTLEKSLLTADGTLYTVQTGLAADLGAFGKEVTPEDFVIRWTAKRQDGTTEVGIIPGTSRNPKEDLELAYDEENRALVLLYGERASFLKLIHLGIRRDDLWETIALLPNQVFPQAANPQMLLTRHTFKYEGEDGKEVSRNRSVLSIIWWDEQARFVPLFLDEDLSAQDIQIYDLAVLIGGGGPAFFDGVPAGAYSYPSLQAEGPGGGILASFADLNKKKHYVVRITYPQNLERLRRRIPVVGVTVGHGPLAAEIPMAALSVGTVLGSGYQPILYWRDKDAVRYTRYDGKAWASAKFILLDETMTYEKAKRLVEEMAKRN